MPFSRPSLTELIRRDEKDMEARVTGAPLMRNSVLRVIARVVAGSVHMLFGYLDHLAENLMPDRAQGEWLRRWARIYRVEELAATYAEGMATVATTSEATVPAGTVLVRSDGALYETTADAVAIDDVLSVPVSAVEAGADGNALAGTELTLQSPVPGITSPFAVLDDITNGADDETIEQLRERLLLRVRNPPQGGSAVDYQRWALSIAGVTRAWVYPGWMGAGTVGVAVVNDNAPDISPGQDVIDQVDDYIDTLRPVTAEVFVFAPEVVEIDHVIELSPPSARDAVTASLAEFYRRMGEPGAIIRLSQINEAISTAEGEQWHRLVEPATDVTPEQNQIPVLGEITWV